jgi:hypothetical protein
MWVISFTPRTPYPGEKRLRCPFVDSFCEYCRTMSLVSDKFHISQVQRERLGLSNWPAWLVSFPAFEKLISFRRVCQTHARLCKIFNLKSVYLKHTVVKIAYFTSHLYQYKYYIFGHYPSSCIYLQNRPVYFLKHNVSETGFCPYRD